MSFSKKTIPIALLMLGGFSGTCLADAPSSYIYIPEHKDNVIDDAKGRRLLAGLANVDLKEIWFITGNEYPDEKDQKCLSARDLWLFTKPAPSSDGIWRGKKTYVTQKPETNCSQKVETTPVILNIGTATYSDPADIYPEEAWDGQVPGVFQIYNGITDSELVAIGNDIADIRACLKKEHDCAYAITKETGHTPDYDLTAALKTKNLLTLSTRGEYGTDKQCYSMIFAGDKPYSGAVGMDICYRNDKISKVILNDDIIE